MSVFSLSSQSSLLLINQRYVYAGNETTEKDKKPLPDESSCPACVKTSPYLEKYIKFSDEIIDTMKKFANSESSIWATRDNPTNGSSNDSNENPDALRALQAITESINKKGQIAATAAYLGIFTAGEMLGNARYSMGMLGSSNSLSRDWNRLEEVQQKTLNVATDLGNEGIFVRIGFKPGLEEAIQDVFNTYSNGDEALFVINKGNTATSQPIIIFTDLWAMTNNLKFGLYDSTFLGIYGNVLNGAREEKYMGGTLSLSPGFIDNILSYYKCAKGIIGASLCSTVGKMGDARFKNIENDGKEQAGYAIDIIKTAWKRLSGFRSDNAESKEALKNREYELLRSQYGRRAANPGIIKQITEGSKKGRKTSKEAYTNAISTIEGIFHKGPKKTKKVVIGDQQIEAINDIEKETMAKVGTDTAQEANQSRHESEYGNPAAVTKLFPILTQNIIMQKLLIDGKGDKTTINENLGSACLNQCTNIPGKKCSYDE